jgi:choice-of-anchor A domain-containing protein
MRILALALLAPLLAAPARAALSAADFQVFSLGPIRYAHSDFEGRAGAAGGARFSDFSLGAKEGRGAATLIVGGSAQLSDGSVLRGGVRAGARVTLTRVDVHGAVVEDSGDAAQLAAVSRELLAASDRLAALPADSSESWDGGLVLAARPGAARTLIRLSAERLGEARVVVLRVAAGATLVVDVTGASASLSNAEFRREGEGGIVFNFAGARALTITGVAVPGVVLAPRAATRFVSGRIDGRLYVGGLEGDGQVNETGASALPQALGGLSGGDGAIVRARLPESSALTERLCEERARFDGAR